MWWRSVIILFSAGGQKQNINHAHLAHAKQRSQNITLKSSLVSRVLGEQERLKLAKHCHDVRRAAGRIKQRYRNRSINQSHGEKKCDLAAPRFGDLAPTTNIDHTS